MAKTGAPKAAVANEKSGPDDAEAAEKKEKPAWRHSPFASAEIGIAAKAPEFILPFAHAMAWHPDEDEEYLLGQLLASAVVHGALLCGDVWKAWVEGLAYVQECDELLWIDMNLHDDHGSTYRWFADPTTRILILKWRTLGADVEGVSARHCLQKFLLRFPNAHPTEDRVSLFVDWAVMHWRLRLPPLLLDQALCRLPTTTLSNKVWLEVMGMPPETRTRSCGKTNGRVTYSANANFAASKKLLRKFNGNGSIESRIFEEAWKLRSKGAFTRRQEKNFCVRQLTAVRPTLSPGRQELASWAIARLAQKRARPSPKGFAPFTVRQWLYSILEGVYPDSYRQDDFRIPLDGMSADIKSVIGKARNENELLIKAAQKDFGRYQESLKPVRAAEGAEEELETLFGDNGDDPVEHRTTVSAKILSPRMFQQAVKRARAWSSNDQTALIIILGYRAGLRFAEIEGLQVHDFIIKENEIFELHVQRNRHRHLKTFDSRRILPLDVLLTTKEQEALRRWLEARLVRAKQSGKNVYCFGPPESRTPISDGKKFVESVLNNKKKGSVGDRGPYTFSHLRHSFSSFLLASLLLPEETKSALVPKAFKSVVCVNRKKILSDRLLGKERLGQAALHAVSQTMGHTGIYRTLESYQHLLDLLLGLYVSRRALQPAFPPEVHSSLEADLSRPKDNVMSAFADAFRDAPRSAPVGGAYAIPSPPRSLSSPTSDPSWRRLDLQNASASYNLTPLLPQTEDVSGNYAESGPLESRFDVPNPVWSEKSWDWNAVWTIVTSRDDQTQDLRNSISLSPETFREWKDRYKKILIKGFSRQGRCRNDEPRLVRPIGAPALSLVDWMWIRRTATSISPKGRRLIRTFLTDYNEESFYSRMPSLEDAVQFAAFLRDVGVEGSRIVIAQGRASDFKNLKSGEAPTRDVRDGDSILYKTWDPPAAFMRKPQNDRRPALWISYIKYEDASLGRSFDLVRPPGGSSPPETGRRFVQHKVNYAYRFALAMMAIVDDEVWSE